MTLLNILPQKPSTVMATRTELYPSRWLAASDCETPMVATIMRCTIETVGQGTKAERKPVVYFTGALKPLICNKTNYDVIAGISGEDDTDNWGGTDLELYAVDVNGPNGPTRGVRVRRPRKAATSRPRPAAVVPDQIDEAMPSITDEPVL